MSKTKRIETEGGESLGQNAFAGLSLGDLPEGPQQDAAPEKKAGKEKKQKKFPLVLRREKKGRGGKTVTVLEAPDHSIGPRLEALLQVLKKSLGRGGQREGRSLVLQGEPDERLRELVENEGFRLKG
ncbi:MAG: translation initiation factor [Opitutales bacterium]|nr:translation initiation factor [Opitutales bacterium]MCH8540243.1 translation initiation factor [Opitutales bacterium]